jgi:hypothetical protein
MAGFASSIRRFSTASLVGLMIAGLAQSPAAAATVVSADNFEGVDTMNWQPVEGSSMKRYTDNEGGKLLLLAGSPYLPAISKQTAVDGGQSMCVSLGVAGSHDAHSDRSEVEIDSNKGGWDIPVGRSTGTRSTCAPART